MRIIHLFIGLTLTHLNHTVHCISFCTLNRYMYVYSYVYIENTKNVWIDVLEIKKMIACLKRMRRNCFDYLGFVFDIRGGKRQTGNKL